MKQTIKTLAAIIVAAILPSIASAQYFEAGGIVYGITSETEQTVEVWPNIVSEDYQYRGDIVIPQTVTHDGTSYTVTALSEAAFESNTEVTSLSLPATIRSIGNHCFYNCRFTSLQLPDSLRSIDSNAFLYSSVESLHLPAHFEKYGDAAFWARNLMSITVDEENPRYRSIDGWLYSKDSLTLYLVPDGVTGTVEVPSFVRHLGRQAFGNGTHITTITLPEGLESIGAFAFNCCSAINNVVIPSSVTHIGVCPFSYCPQLTNLSIAPGNSHYVMEDLMIYSSGYDTLVSCHKSGATVTLNSNLKVLGGFECNTWVRNITIPEGVTDITENCFNGCSFSSIALPAHMKSIGVKAFSENYSLVRVTMPQTLLSMGRGAFEWCIKLTSIVIPDSLRMIPKEAFNSCPRLSAITWGDAVEEIGYAAFWAMSAVHLELPATLRKLDDYAFAACSNRLQTVTIQGQVDTMGTAVFSGSNLDHIRFTASVPPAIKGAGPLDQVGRIDSVLIPCGSLNAWLADSYWQNFADKFHEDCNGIDGATEEMFTVYPNPASSDVTIQVGEPSVLSVIDMTGREVMAPTEIQSILTISLSTLPSGTCFLRLQTSSGIVTKKVIVF